MEAACPTDVPVPRPAPPIYPRWVRREQPLVTRELVQFIALSMALHMLAIALFGAPGGGNREGRAMWGPLSVVIRDSWRDTGPSLKMDRELPPVASRIPPSPRGEGRRAPPVPPPPAAAPVDLGLTKALQPPVEAPIAPAVEPPKLEPAIPKIDAAPSRAEPAPPKAEPAPAAVEAPYVVPPLLERLPVTDPLKDLAPAPKVPPPTVEAPRASSAPPGEGRGEGQRTPPPTVEAPRPSPSPLGEGRGEGQRTPPPAATAPPKVEVPAVPLPPLPAPTMLDRVTAPRVERQLAEPPPMPAPIVPPAPMITQPAAPPVPALPPVPVERAPVEAPPVPAITPPVTRPALEAPPLPVPRDDLAAPPRLPPVPRASEPSARPDVPAPRVAPEATRIEAPAAPARDPVPRPDPRAAPSTGPGAAPAPLGEDRGGSQRPPPSSTYDPTAPAPTIDLDAVRRRAGDLARQGTGNKAPLAFPMPPVPQKKSTMEQAIENARKPDCREAYKSLGLAAVVPLIANEFGEGNCRW